MTAAGALRAMERVLPPGARVLRVSATEALRRHGALWPVAVAIPARDEERRIGSALRALARTLSGEREAGVVVHANNCRDRTADAALAAAGALGLRAAVAEVALPPELAHAGWARRVALDLAALRLRPGGLLMTTDADGRVAPDWLDANRTALRDADLVCGRFEIDRREMRSGGIAPNGLPLDEAAYLRRTLELDRALDPVAAEVPPAHAEASGASLALRLDAHQRMGGAPTPEVGEDRALVSLARRSGLRVRHVDEAVVTVSGRMSGRAEGGLASALTRLGRAEPRRVDDRLMPARQVWLRARARRGLRRAWTAGRPGGDEVFRRLGLGPEVAEEVLTAGSLGAGWALLEDACPTLAPVPVSAVVLPVEAARLDRLLAAASAGGHGGQTS